MVATIRDGELAYHSLSMTSEPKPKEPRRWLLLAAMSLVPAATLVPLLMSGDLSVPTATLSLLLAAILVLLSLIDIESFTLPDRLTFPLIAMGVAVSAVLGQMPPWWSVVSGAIGYASIFGIARGYQALRGRAGIGLGDAKLFAAAGTWTGAETLPSVLLWACVAALIFLLAAAATGRAFQATTRIPFGPFLALGFWIGWIYGPI